MDDIFTGSLLSKQCEVAASKEDEMLDPDVRHQIELAHLKRRKTLEVDLARRIRGQLDRHHEFPRRSVALVRVRYKGFDRMVEKLDRANGGEHQISAENYHEFVKDLLGIRYVTLLPSHQQLVCDFINRQAQAGRFRIVESRDVRSFERQSFDPDDPDATTTIHAHGYSSLHYIVRVDDDEAKGAGHDKFMLELQVRSIFQEAWAEIDHRYRYEADRSGISLSDYVTRGFVDLSHYLLSVARHAEHLCEAAAAEIAEARKADDNVAAGSSAIPPERSAFPEYRPLADAIGDSLGVSVGQAALRGVSDAFEFSGMPTEPEVVAELLRRNLPGFLEVCRDAGLREMLFDGKGEPDRELIILVQYCIAREREDEDAASALARREIQRYLS